MTERVDIRDLNELDGFAVRTFGDDVVVIISSAVSELDRQRLAEELSTAVRFTPGNCVTVMRHRDAARQSAKPRRRAKTVVMAIAAALIINFDLAG